MKENKTRVLVFSLLAVIVVLLCFVLYMFVVKPVFAGYVINAQNEGYVIAFAQIIERVSDPSCLIVPLTLGNQTVEVVNVQCLPQPTE